MQFEWDQRKAAANIRKHGVAFTDAIAVFSDPLARIFPDPDHSEAEERELMVGYDSTARLLYVSFVERRGNVRIISARRATAREASTHEKHLK
jgi:uncharacterized protein